MKRAIRMVMMAALAAAMAGGPAAGLAQEQCPEAKAQAQAESKKAPETAKASDPCTDIEPGAAAMEPKQASEDPEAYEKSRAHEQFLKEVWEMP